MKPDIFASLTIFATLVMVASFATAVSTKEADMSGISDMDKLKLFGKMVDQDSKFRGLSKFEAEHIKGKTPTVLVAIAWGAGAGGMDAIVQYTTTGQVNFWSVAQNASAGFFGGLTGGLAVPAIGQLASGVLGGGVGVVAYNVTGYFAGGSPSLSSDMVNWGKDQACGGCHD